MTKAIAQTYTVAHEYRVQITTALLATCLVLVAIYGANVYMLISRTVALQQTESQINTLSSEVAKLDTQYLQISSAVTPASLKARGFEQGQASAYITRSASLGSVALSGHEL